MESITKILTFNAKEPFIFTSLPFWLFFGVVLFGNALFYRRNLLRNGFLFLVSLFFYYRAGGYFFSLLIFSTVVDFLIGIGIYRVYNLWSKRLLLLGSVCINIGVLAYYKYAYFLIGGINDLWDLELVPMDYVAGITNWVSGSNFDISVITLPVGISFFTFQTISYSVDVYRGKLKPVTNIVDFGFYVSFFPQLVAGPIVRARDFIPQLYKEFSLTNRQLWHAGFLIVAGLFKKIVFSDFLAVNFIDRVFESPVSFTGFENLLGILGYSLQIYGDFSGYTDIATGIALLLGFRLPLNFNSPYKACSLTDFWRRWHISLSFWLRDYIYISLGGNRKGKVRMGVNLMVTMLLGGLWHGANWRFICWGGLHGVGLLIDKAFNYWFPHSFSPFRRLLGFTLTFSFVTFSWVIFRAESPEVCFTMLSRIVYAFSWNTIPQVVGGYWMVVCVIIFGYFSHWLPYSLKDRFRGFFIHAPLAIKILFVLFVIFIAFQFKSADLHPFIYFQF